MAIGTPVNILAIQNTGSGSNNTLSAAASAGSLIVVLAFAWAGVNGTATACSDSAGNTYTLATQNPATSGIGYPCAIFYSSNISNALTTSSTIAVTNSGGVNQSLAAFSISGANGGPDTGTYNHVSASSSMGFSMSTGTLAASSEIIIGLIATTGNLGTVTPNSGFTLMSGYPIAGQDAYYQIVSSNTSVTFNPSWTNAADIAAVIAGFEATGSGGGAVDDIAPRSSLVSLIHW